MKKYFEAKLNYTKIDNEGRERKVTESYILEAVSFTDAEATMTAFGRQITKGEFTVKGIKESNVENIITIDGEYAYKAKVTTLTIDEVAGREKRFSSYWLVFAADFYEAHKTVQIESESIVVPVEIESIQKTQIIELVEVS